jgi:hypothetical protein
MRRHAVFLVGAVRSGAGRAAADSLSLSRNSRWICDLPEGAPRSSRHRHLLAEPVPRSLGPNALGNPELPRARNHQHLLRTPFWRQYHHFSR